MSRATPNTFVIRPIDRISLACALILWLAPMIYRGLANRLVPGLPRALTFLQNVSALFPSSMKFWRVDYIQVLPEGSSGWITVPETDYFQMTPFGHRTRLNQLFNWPAGKASSQLQAELAVWIRERYITQHPELPKPVAVRFIAAQYPVNRDVPTGYWRNPALGSFPPQNLFIMSTHRFGDKPLPASILQAAPHE